MAEPRQRPNDRRSSRAGTVVILAVAAALVALGVALLHREPAPARDGAATGARAEPRRASRANVVLTAGETSARPLATATAAPDDRTVAPAATGASVTPGGLIPGIPSRSLPTHPLIFHHPDAAPPN